MSQPSSPTPPKPEDRLKIAIQVLNRSMFGVSLLAVVAIGSAAYVGDKTTLADTSKYVFASLIPLFGTWIGTIIAFYFSTESYQAASDSVRATMRDLQKERLSTFIAGETMRPYDQIYKVELDDSNPATMHDVPIDAHFTNRLTRQITRIPVFTKNRIAKYMLHGSVLYEFLAEIQSDNPVVVQRGQATLKDFLEYKDGKYKKLVSGTFVFAGKSVTLASAKTAMEQISKQSGGPCQDVFVTETGVATEQVLGWLSDKRIERYTHLEG